MFHEHVFADNNVNENTGFETFLDFCLVLVSFTSKHGMPPIVETISTMISPPQMRQCVTNDTDDALHSLV